MHLVSASRRTDIPHFFAAWFAQCRRQGFARYRTVYGGGRAGFFKASLLPRDVIGYLFWTKFAGPFHAELAALRHDGVPYVFQYTITGYGRDVQPGIPDRDTAIADFKKVAAGLPGPECIQLRYDPILLSSLTYTPAWHLANFDYITARLAGLTRVVNVSFAQPYRAALARTPPGHTIDWRAKNAAPPPRQMELVKALADLAGRRGLQLRFCCNGEYTGFPPAQCCGPELFSPYGAALHLQVMGLKAAPSRPGCRCLKSVDIGTPDTCPAGCFYCYINKGT